MPKIEDFVEGDPVVEDGEDDSDEDSDDEGPPERERPASKFPLFREKWTGRTSHRRPRLHT